MNISIVFAGRNDNYGGNFAERLMYALLRNKHEAEKREINTEFIWVEWNPPNDNYLSYCLAPLGVQCYVVAPTIHREMTTDGLKSPYTPIAKNVGIRRANGDWILVTNPDVVFGDDVWNFINSGNLDADILYRAERRDVNCECFTCSFEEMELTKERTHKLTKRMTNASGDFLLFSSKHRYGFNENANNTAWGLDGNFLFAWPGSKKVIGRIYKADHPEMGMKTFNTDEWKRGKRRWNLRCPYINPPDWGVATGEEKIISKRITYIGGMERAT